MAFLVDPPASIPNTGAGFGGTLERAVGQVVPLEAAAGAPGVVHIQGVARQPSNGHLLLATLPKTRWDLRCFQRLRFTMPPWAA